MSCFKNGCHEKSILWCECNEKITLVCNSHISEHISSFPSSIQHQFKPLSFSEASNETKRALLKYFNFRITESMLIKANLIQSATKRINDIEQKLQIDIKNLHKELNSYRFLIKELHSTKHIPNIGRTYLQEITLLPYSEAITKAETLISDSRVKTISLPLENIENLQTSITRYDFQVRSEINYKNFSNLYTFNGHRESVRQVLFPYRNINYIISASMDETVRLWSLLTQKEIRVLKGHDRRINSCAISPCGNCVASASSDKQIKLWNVYKQKVIKVLKGHQKSVRGVVFSSCGQFLASGSNDTTIRYWNLKTYKSVCFNGHLDEITSISMSSDGAYIASGSRDKTVKLWKISTKEILKEYKGHACEVRCVAFSPDGKQIASCDVNGLIFIWSVEKESPCRELIGHEDRVDGLAFSPCGKFIASASRDKTIRIWNCETGEIIKELIGHSENVRSVAFSYCGKYLVSGAEDCSVKLWGIKEDKFSHETPGYATVNISNTKSHDYITWL
ncbi:unnamed protein product [Blepharisma stoltei]|uniref:Uncharacterized protein n=1 Tax=Blepharisma stoltei TaxID=1481888 RepID=A0AAU9J411_9CILI|nr:unnamed protein product [Blepharisma stoltei]